MPSTYKYMPIKRMTLKILFLDWYDKVDGKENGGMNRNSNINPFFRSTIRLRLSGNSQF
jgi:hypothetical protein